MCKEEKNEILGNSFIPMGDYRGIGFDNETILGMRFSFVLVEQGAGVARLDGNVVPYIAPCIFCISEQERFVIVEEEGSSVRAALFHPSVINSYLDFQNARHLPEDVPFTLSQDNDLIKYFLHLQKNQRKMMEVGPFTTKKIRKLLEGIHELTTEQNSPNWPCRSRSYLMELLFLLDNLFDEEGIAEETSIRRMEEEFYPVLRYLYHNYEKKLSVADITKEFHLNKTTLAKMFQDNLGETFVAYLNRLRVTMAGTMLRDTMLPVCEIMMRVGFNDNAHFLRTFKKITGLSPSAYREKYCWM